MVTGIVILNYNNAVDTVACVDSIIEHNTAEIVMVVVDNGSTDNSGELLDKELRSRFDDFQTVQPQQYSVLDKAGACTLILSSTNEGYARGNNMGIECMLRTPSVESILILNNDVLFIEDIIPKLKEVLQNSQNVGVVSPLLVKENGRDIRYSCARKNHTLKEIYMNAFFLMRDPLGVVGRLRDKRMILKDENIDALPQLLPIELPSGSCMIMRKEVIEYLGGLDGHTFLYFEENILFKRLETLKLKNYLVTDLRCVHLGGQSISKIPNIQMQKHSLESAFYYMKTYEHINLMQQWVFKGLIKLNLGLRYMLGK